MKVGSVNSSQNLGFKSAMPVIIKIGQDFESAAPIVGKELNDRFMRKTVLRLNDSLKRGINPKRDGIIDKLREYFGRLVTDFEGKVTSYTCVDGELKDGVLTPYFYFLTGNEALEIEKLRESHKQAVVQSQGYDTANLRISKDDYYNIGKNFVLKSIKKFNPKGNGPEAFFVCFEPIRNKKGIIKDYEIKRVGFRPIADLKNPSITLDKLA